ncbi:MAG: DNA internalization-related competence protein ComEC/Rec2 [Fibrobacterales bacterium]
MIYQSLFKTLLSSLKELYQYCARHTQYHYGILLALAFLSVGFSFHSVVLSVGLFVAVILPLLFTVPIKSKFFLVVGIAIASLQWSVINLQKDTPLPSSVTLSGSIQNIISKPRQTTIDLSTPLGLIKLNIPSHDSTYDLATIQSLVVGDSLSAQGSLQEPSPVLNPGQFDYDSFLKTKGFKAIYSADVETLIHSSNHSLRGYFYKMRVALSEHISTLFDGHTAPLIKALVLGNKKELPQESATQFRETGLYHLLAISGLHIALIALIIQTLFTLIRIPQKGVIVLTILLLWTFALIVNLPPSVVRATTMYTILALAWLFERRPFSMNALGLAIALILCVEPMQIADIGFQLSAGATFAILYFSHRISSLFPKSLLTQYIYSPLAITLFATAGTAPILIHTFNTFAPASFIGNLFAVPLISLTLLSSLVSLIISPLSHDLGLIFAESTNLFALASTEAIALFHSFVGAPIYIAPFQPIAYGIYSILILSLPHFFKNHRVQSLSILVFSLGIIFWGGSELYITITQPTHITLVAVGNGESMFIESSNGKTMLIDTGYDSKSIGQYRLIPFLKYHGIDHLDAVLITHKHRDHYGNLTLLAKSVTIGAVYTTPPSDNHDDNWEKTVQYLTESDVPIHSLSGGDNLSGFGMLTIDVLAPLDTTYENENNNSLVMLMRQGQQSILLTGDIEKPVEKHLLNYFALPDIDILKAAHHGSNTSSTLGFLRQVKPELTVISAGTNKRFKHPSRDIRERFDKLGIPWYATRYQGALDIYLTGSGYELEAFVEEPLVR